MRIQSFKLLLGVLGATLTLGTAAYAQDAPTAKLHLTVHPKQAYTFVDGQARGPGNRTVPLTMGTHHLIVANYGYKFFQQDVSVDSTRPIKMDVNLEANGTDVSGPRGRIQIEVGSLDAGDDAVLLNGKTPAYFVGHVDEFNNEILAQQELIVPPGIHQVTVTRHGEEVWSGKVSVEADQRVIVTISNGKQVVKPWPRGSKRVGAMHRFQAGIITATIVVAPVSGSISASPAKINCSQPSRLDWASAETIDADISGMSPVPTNGEKTVSPRQTTTYTFTATGPGGVTKSSATIEVNPVVQSSLIASPVELQYRRIGDKVIKQESTTLNWSSSNSDSALLTPLGSVATVGTRSVTPDPTQTAYGPVDENFNYTLTAKNVCGGMDTKTVAVHVKGSIEPIPAVPLSSVFYPTAYPDVHNPNLGLLESQRQTLKAVATGFIKYLEYDPQAKLSLIAHADPRGAVKPNEALALRRGELAKQFLISRGIAAEKIEVTAVGKEQPLDPQMVAQLESVNPNHMPEARAASKSTTELAYQRRVDIVLSPTKAESARFYPNTAADSQILWQRPMPARSVVEKNQ
jgi:hypothetical protein